MKKDIKLFISEIKGVWTDGSFYIDSSGNEFQQFNYNDLTGIDLLKRVGIKYLLICEEKHLNIKKAMDHLGIEHFVMDLPNKESFLDDYLKKETISWKEVAYIGSNKEDIHLLKKVGLSATPASAPFYIKNISDWILRSNGGNGVFSEFVEDYLEEKGILKKSLYLD